MKIDMHLFSLIVALATSVTDGRISSSLSSSSSSSQPLGGSAVNMTPNRRDLQPALGTHYCTVTEDGTQRGVVDWQGIDQCHKCEGGQLYWPCGTNNANLCTGFCTPEAVCDERLRAAAAAAETPTAAASDCTAELEKAEKLLEEAEKLFLQELESSDAARLTLRAEKESLLEEKNAAEEQLSSFVEVSSDCTAVTAEKEDLEAELALLSDLAERDQEDLADLRNTILELKETVTNVNEEKALLLAQLASDKIQQEIEEEKEKEEFEKDEATNFDYASFYNTIKNRPIDDRTPTYCPSTVGDLEGRKARLLGEIEMIESDIKQIDSEKDYLEQFQEKGLDSKNNSVNCRCETSPSSSQLSWKQVCSGGCSGTDSCLNLDFVCSPSAPICELNCSGRNSCNGLTMYCGDNQACAITCSPYWDSCVGAKVVYNGMEFGKEQEWKSPPAEDIRYFRFN